MMPTKFTEEPTIDSIIPAPENIWAFFDGESDMGKDSTLAYPVAFYGMVTFYLPGDSYQEPAALIVGDQGQLLVASAQPGFMSVQYGSASNKLPDVNNKSCGA